MQTEEAIRGHGARGDDDAFVLVCVASGAASFAVPPTPSHWLLPEVYDLERRLHEVYMGTRLVNRDARRVLVESSFLAALHRREPRLCQVEDPTAACAHAQPTMVRFRTR